MCGKISLAQSELCIALRCEHCVALHCRRWENCRGRGGEGYIDLGMGGTYKLDFA
jgi:hypothetical protein